MIRRLVRELPVPLEFVSFIGDAWMCRLNERGIQAKADVADKSTDWLVENGYGTRWEVVIIRVECKYGGYHLHQPYVRRTGRMYFEGPPEGHEFLLGEEAGQQTFFAAPRPMKEMLEKERKPS